VFGAVTVAVPPHYTSLNCSNYAKVVKKTLSTGTHTCPYCGHIQDRDHNAARNILEKALGMAADHVGTKDTALGGDAEFSHMSATPRREIDQYLG